MANNESIDGSARGDSPAPPQGSGMAPATSPPAPPNTAFCVHPWIHLRLQSTGEGQVCCRYRTNISPRYLSIDALPPSVRRVAESRLREYADGDCRPSQRELVQGLAEQVRPKDAPFDPGVLRDCMLFTNDLDVSRGQRLADANGELIERLATAGYPWIDDTVHARRDDRALASTG